MTPDDVKAALPVIRSRCEEIGRDPASLPVSVHVWPQVLANAGRARVEQLAAYREVGVSRVMTLLHASATSDEALESLAADARAAGVEMGEGVAAY